MTEQEIQARLQAQLFNGTLHEAINRVINEARDIFENEKKEISFDDIPLIIRLLDNIGFFELRYAVAKMASLLSVSRVTIYNHLNRLNSI